MRPFALFAVAALSSAAAAKHMHHFHHKRDISWHTDTVTVTDLVMETHIVWVDEDGAPLTSPAASISAAETPAATSAAVVQATTTPVEASHTVAFTPSTSSTPVVVPTTADTPDAPSSTVVPVIPEKSVAPVVSSVEVAASSVYTPPPAPVTTQAAAPSPAANAPNAANGPLAGRQYTGGELTYYAVGMGACGITSTPSENVVAISHTIYDQYTPGGNPNNNPLCGTKISISVNGQTIDATVVDRCEACEPSHIDLSQGLFEKFASTEVGVVPGVTWNWL